MIEQIPADLIGLMVAGLFGSKTSVTTEQDILVGVEANPAVNVAVDVPPVDLRPIAEANRNLADAITGALGIQARAVAAAADVDAAASQGQAGAIRDAGRNLVLAAVGVALAWSSQPMTHATYTVLTLDLTTAGEESIDGPWGVIRFLDALDAAGDIVGTAKVTVQAEREGEGAPLRLGQGFLARETRRFIISWAAQSGVTATLGLAERPELIDWDADPPAKLAVGSIKLKGSSVLTTTTDASVAATTAAQVLAGNANRRYAVIQNLDTNTAAVRVGDSNVGSARGHNLVPGDSIVLETTAAISVYNTHSAAQSVGLVEIGE